MMQGGKQNPFYNNATSQLDSAVRCDQLGQIVILNLKSRTEICRHGCASVVQT